MTQWTSQGFRQVADLVRERTGLVFPDARVSDVEETIRRIMTRRGITDLRGLTSLLRDDEAAREAFVADLTIGESYFQRDPVQFTLLREQVLPQLLESRPADRPVRVWSAGCSAGEEPYTVAMLFDELGMLDRCDIVGTDIARPRLAQAQSGVYSNWSLRNTGPELRDRYFTARGRFFELTPRIRARVDFSYLNLAEDQYPSLSTGIWGMDLILCRNVLIYFDKSTVEHVAQRLIASLGEDGWLLLGASDPAISDMVDCDVVLTDAGLAYRRPGAAGSGDVRGPQPHRSRDKAWWNYGDVHVATDTLPAGDDAAAWSAAWQPAAEPADAYAADPAAELEPQTAPEVPVPADTADAEIVSAYDARDFDVVSELAAASADGGTIGLSGWTAWVRALANQGCLDQAGEVVARALDAHGVAAELMYLHAVLLLQAGRAGDAAAAARRALYLDRKLVVAHLTLAEAERRSGSRAGEKRALPSAAALLDALPHDAEVPASDGETAGRMAELVRVTAGLLERAT
ncbi:hypothetical protein BH23GEM10_BH23GEM10_02840 [soil metagenome]